MTRKKTHFFLLLGLTFPDFSGIIFPVSERNTMKDKMTMTEIRRHFEERRLRTFADRQTKETRRLEKLKAAKEKMKKSCF